MSPMSAPTLKLLIVDDNPDDRFVYRRLLAKVQDWQLEIIEADCGAAALAAIAAHELQCVLLDFHLPDVHGLDLLRQIRAAHPRLPVVMLTGLDDVNTSVAALQSGADDYQTKDRISADSLLRAVRGALERRALEAQLAAERERLELFYQLVEQSADLLLVIRMPDRRLIELNEATTRQLGYSRQQLADIDLDRVLPDVGGMWSRLTEQQPELRCDCQVVCADGRLLPVDANARRVVLSQHEYLVLVLRDATQQREMESQLRRLVLLDALTGISNRRAFDERFEQEFLRAARGHGSLGLLMIDVDYFKLYNDTYGHPAGDKCLRLVAQALSGALKRPSDFVARYGGEEFAVLLPDANLEGTQAAAEMLLARIRELALPHAGSSSGLCVTVSIGAALATPPVHGQLESFMEKADQHLYEAKISGRNRVVFAA